MIKKILLVLAAFVAVVLVLAAFKPKTFLVTRSTTIAAPAEAIFPHVNDVAKVNAWSPWMAMDPAIKVTYAGPAAGIGASSSWVGNSSVGEGSQTIVESVTNERVKLRLDFKKPFEATSMGEFTLKPQGNQTVVTWSLSGDNNFIGRVICLFMNQEKMIGEPFETGLASLKKRVETEAKR